MVRGGCIQALLKSDLCSYSTHVCIGFIKLKTTVDRSRRFPLKILTICSVYLGRWIVKMFTYTFCYLHVHVVIKIYILHVVNIFCASVVVSRINVEDSCSMWDIASLLHLSVLVYCGSMYT